jgi:hypothetical protein
MEKKKRTIANSIYVLQGLIKDFFGNIWLKIYASVLSNLTSQ